MSQKEYLGIDIGASGIKGAIVNIKKGDLVSERLRLPTPQPSTPKEVAKTFAQLVKDLNWSGKIIGVGFPAVVKRGVAKTAANIHKDWINTDIEKLFTKATGCDVFVRNDADVAGLAEMRYGVGQNRKDTVLIITIGSGLGSAVFRNGFLVPNTELGHFYLKGHNKVVEQFTSDGARKRQELSWKEWAKRFDRYLETVTLLLAPDLIILGGGGSKKFEKFESYLKFDKVPLAPAELLNNAGIIGAARYAYQIEQAVLELDA
jgi:polyphosphate glucokinase